MKLLITALASLTIGFIIGVASGIGGWVKTFRAIASFLGKE